MRGNFFYYLLSPIIVGVFSTFIMVPITTYYLTPNDFGVMAIIMAITMPIGPLTFTGATWVLAGSYYKIEGKEKKILVFNILLIDFIMKFFWVLIFSLLAPIFLPIVIKEFKPQYVLYFRLSLLSSLLATFWPSISYYIVLQQKGRSHAVFEISQWVVGALTTIVCLVIFKLATITLFVSPLASSIILFIMGLWYIKNHIVPELSKKWIIELFKVGIQSSLWNVSETFVNISDRYFIQKWINLSQLGIYSHSLGYRNIFTMGTKAFSKALSPYLLEIFSKRLDVKTLECKIKKYYGILGISGLLVVLSSYKIVKILTHDKFTAAAPLIPIWYLLLFSFAYGFSHTQFLLANKKNIFMTYTGILINVFFIGITMLATYKFSIIGASVSIVLSNFVIQLARKSYARKLGSPVLAEREFVFIVGLFLFTYFLNFMWDFSFIFKSTYILTLSFLIVWKFNLLNDITNQLQKVLSFSRD